MTEKIEEEVPDKYKVEDSKRGADRGRSSSLEWRRVCARILALFTDYNLQRRQSMHEDSTEGEEMKRHQRMKIMKEVTKIGSKGRMDADNRWWVSELLAADCEKAWLHDGWEDTMQKWTDWLGEMNKEDERKKMEELHQQKGKSDYQECERQRWAPA